MKPQKHNRCPTCNTNEPCVRALDSIRSIQYEIARKGDVLSLDLPCEWYVNSVEYGYSFSNMLKDLQGDPISDKEICQLLLITPLQLSEIYTSAIRKLAAMEDKTVLYNMLDLASELSPQSDDSTVYFPESFREKINESFANAMEEPEEKVPGKRGRKPKAKTNEMDDKYQPRHHSGKSGRKDIYFASSKKSMEIIAESKKKLDEKKKDK